jgi:hypothetical protein
MVPFGDDAASDDVGGLTVENGSDRIAVYGQTDLTRDKTGLGKAKEMAAFFQAVVDALEKDAALPEQVARPPVTVNVLYPFGT